MRKFLIVIPEDYEDHEYLMERVANELNRELAKGDYWIEEIKK